MTYEEEAEFIKLGELTIGSVNEYKYLVNLYRLMGDLKRNKRKNSRLLVHFLD